MFTFKQQLMAAIAAGCVAASMAGCGATAAPTATPAPPTTTALPTATPVPTPTIDPALIERGKKAYVNSGCTACHAIKGVGTQGVIGPDLTHIATLAEGILASDEYKKATGDAGAKTVEAYLVEALLNPNAYVPLTCPQGPCQAGAMPNNYAQAIREGDRAALVAYLLSLR